MYNALLIVQVILSILLVTFILLQPGEGGWTGLGSTGGENYHTRRGVEKVIYYATIICVVLFIVNSVVILLLSGS